MALTLGGLLYVQLMYLHNMLQMSNDLFEVGVARSLRDVAAKLEADETKHFLNQDMADFEYSFSPGSSSSKGDNSSEMKYSFTTAEGLKGDLTVEGNVTPPAAPRMSSGYNQVERNKMVRENMKGKFLSQKKLLDEVIIRILNQSSERPIQERADSAVVHQYLIEKLDENKIKGNFEFAVVNRVGNIVYCSEGYGNGDNDIRDMKMQLLFPNDPVNRMFYLKVYFPAKNDYILDAVKWMIPSLVFTLILIVIFVYTIIVAFRQKKLTEMKNDFINNMTHEFKTPISTISLAAQMLNDSSVLKSPAMLQHISTVINDETKRLRFQVEKVLQMSMFDRQKATLKLTDVDVNVAVANIISTFKLKVEKYGGNIEADLDAEAPMVHVDEMHFTNVIFNLLDNAVKYRRQDTPLKLQVATRDIAGGSKVQISIKDNGIGIRKDDLKKIFEKFYRVSTGNRHDVKGFGLGLAYVHKMITELGGEITVESELGKGTKFIITLPITKS